VLTQTSITGSDDWWLMRLATELGAGFPRMKRLTRYMEGDAPIPEEADPVIRDSLRKFMRISRLNFAEQLCNSVTGRKRPIGFRTAARGDANGDTVADQIYRNNHMRVQYRDLANDEAAYGRAFTIVSNAFDDQGSVGMPIIMRSNGWNTAVATSATRPWLTETAIQIGYDPLLGVDTITLFRPGYYRQAYRVVKTTTIPTNGSVWNPGNDWTWAYEPRPYGFTQDVPVVEFSTPGGVGEFERHIDTLDRINHTILQRLIITAMQAFRQRGISPGKDGQPFPEYYPEGHPNAGEKINYDEIYQAGPAALWFLPTGADVWESQVTDIRPILEAVTSDLKHLAGASSTPLYVLSPEAANGSAEGASLARETNLTKVLDRIDRDTSALGRTMSFAFQAIGDDVRADASQIETLWAPVDFTTMAQKAEAARNAEKNLSRRGIWERIYQMTPAEMVQEEDNLREQGFADEVETVGAA